MHQPVELSWAAEYIKRIEDDPITKIAVQTIYNTQYDYGLDLMYTEVDMVIDEIFRLYDGRMR